MSSWWTTGALAGALSVSGCFSEPSSLEMSSGQDASSTGAVASDGGSEEESGSSGSVEPADSTGDGEEVVCQSQEAARIPRPVELVVAIDPGAGDPTAIENEVLDAIAAISDEPVERSIVLLSTTDYTFSSQCGPLGCGDDCAPDPPNYLHVAADPPSMQPFAIFSNPEAFECALRPAPPEDPDYDRVIVHTAVDSNPPPAAIAAFQTQVSNLAAQYYVACPGCEFDDEVTSPLEELAFANRGFSADTEASGELINLISWAGSARGECYWAAPAPEGYDRDDLEMRAQFLDDGFADLQRVDGIDACDAIQPDGPVPLQWYYAADDEPIVALCPPACLENLFTPLFLTSVMQDFCA